MKHPPMAALRRDDSVGRIERVREGDQSRIT
jgi:hypothetical protein